MLNLGLCFLLQRHPKVPHVETQAIGHQINLQDGHEIVDCWSKPLFHQQAKNHMWLTKNYSASPKDICTRGRRSNVSWALN